MQELTTTETPASKMSFALDRLSTMQRTGSLKLVSETRSVSRPQLDHDGNVYGYEYDIVPTGGITVQVVPADDDDIEALRIASAPALKHAYRPILDMLATVKPIGRSEVKQAAVFGLLSQDMAERGVSEIACREICKEYRQDEQLRFFPNHGEILNRADRRTQVYAEAYRKATHIEEESPLAVNVMAEAEKVPETKKWPSMDTADRNAFIQACRSQGLVFDELFYKYLLPIYGAPRDEFEAMLGGLSEAA